jgi:electron transfer flavoprotein beta subunit
METLDVIVCMKPVPDPGQWTRLKLDPETMLLCRGEIPAVINPLDRNAIEQGVALKEELDATVSVLTMAPPDAELQLREALAMGCDRAYLLTDPAFAGADTLATARCLGAAIERIGSFDLVFCGGYSLDGSTAQVGPQLAELLGVPDLIHVVDLELGEDIIRARCKLEHESVVLESALPAVITFDKEANAPRIATMRGIKGALDKPLTVWRSSDLNIPAEQVGVRGSPTRMLNVYKLPVRRKGEIVQGTPGEAAAELISRLRKEGVLATEGAVR